MASVQYFASLVRGNEAIKSIKYEPAFDLNCIPSASNHNPEQLITKPQMNKKEINSWSPKSIFRENRKPKRKPVKNNFLIYLQLTENPVPNVEKQKTKRHVTCPNEFVCNEK